VGGYGMHRRRWRRRQWRWLPRSAAPAPGAAPPPPLDVAVVSGAFHMINDATD